MPEVVTQGYRAESVGALYDGPPGGYVSVTNVDTGELVLWIKDPAGHVGRVVSSVHTITEHEDGTVTVSPSILAMVGKHGHDWHGFLERGVWRSV